MQHVTVWAGGAREGLGGRKFWDCDRRAAVHPLLHHDYAARPGRRLGQAGCAGLDLMALTSRGTHRVRPGRRRWR